MWNEWEEVADIWEVSAENRRFNFIKHITLSHCKASDTYCHEFYEPTALWDICDGFILWLPLKYDRCKNSKPLTPSERVLSHLILVSHVSVSGSENAVITFAIMHLFKNDGLDEALSVLRQVPENQGWTLNRHLSCIDVLLTWFTGKAGIRIRNG
jgi:hypothetical protein